MLRLIRTTSFSRKKHRRDANSNAATHNLTHVKAAPVTITDDMTEDEVLEYIATVEAKRTSALPADAEGASTAMKEEATRLPSKPASPSRSPDDELPTPMGTLENAQEHGHCMHDLLVEAAAANKATSSPPLSPKASEASPGWQPTELTEDELLRYVKELENREADPAPQATAEVDVEDTQSSERTEALEAQLRKEIRTLAFRNFAAEERAYLEENEAEELQLTREQCGEKAARKVVDNIIQEEWRLLGHAGRAWYIERARWERLRHNHP